MDQVVANFNCDFVNGRLTDAGKAAIKKMESNSIVLHLANP